MKLLDRVAIPASCRSAGLLQSQVEDLNPVHDEIYEFP